jgi:hypothetical protein
MIDIQSDPDRWLMDAIESPEKKVVFFVGAGISVDSGLPNFSQFSRDFISCICPLDLETKYIKKICGRLRPEVLLQIAQQVHKDRTLDFYGYLESDYPNANHFFLALALKAGHCVFTTNVDTLIEQACAEIGFPCHPIVHEKEYEQFLNEQSKSERGIGFESKLFKLHGSIEHDKIGWKKYESIRFVLDRVGLGLAKSQEEVLSTCLRDYDFIFLGYSGNDHFSVLPVLLKVESDQKIYWFKFKPNKKRLDFYQEIGCFRNRKKELLDKASEGTIPEVKWEEISVMEVLSERENSILAIGDSSNTIKNSIKNIIPRDFPNLEKRAFIKPEWVKNVTDFERHLLAAMLLIRMRDVSNRTEDQMKKAEYHARNERERAEVKRLRASTFSVTRRLGKTKDSEDDLRDAINGFKEQGDIVSLIEAHLELANLLRIGRKFESSEKMADEKLSKETLDKAEELLINNKAILLEQNRSYDWQRLNAQMYKLRGLVYGLGKRGTMADKLKAINYCNKAQYFARLAGDVSCSAAVLNARGLIIYQLAERSGNLLREAESSLNDAFALYIRIGDPRTSFQPLRNQLLVQRLRALQGKLHARDYWLDKAQRDCDKARNFLKLIETDCSETSTDEIEVKYRQAQLYGLKGDKKNAGLLLQEVLAYWQSKNDLHQQARVWQDILSLADNWKDELECILPLLSLIESLFQLETERISYKNDILRLENIRDMLIDAYMKAYENHDQESLDKIVALIEQGGKMAEEFGEKDLSTEFKVWSSTHRE